MEYIHYGHKSFDPAKFVCPMNRPYFCKPEGGLWASPVGADFGWKEWCAANDFAELEEENSFRFVLTADAKVWHLLCSDDAKRLPKQENKLRVSTLCPDFERLVADGYDAVELHLSEEKGEHGIADGLYFLLYGWDCDSILILNPDVVETI